MASRGKTKLEQEVAPESPEPLHTHKNVVVFMNGLREFTVEPLEWVLTSVAVEACCTITVVVVTPWLNIPLSAKTSSDIWTKDLQDLFTTRESNVKDPKIQRLVHLSRRHGVVPQIKTERGYPLRTVVVKQITILHPTLVVFDRHHNKRDIEYCAEKVSCDMVLMKDEGEVAMIKGRSRIDDFTNTSRDSIASTSWAPSPVLILKKILNPRAREKMPRTRRIPWEDNRCDTMSIISRMHF